MCDWSKKLKYFLTAIFITPIRREGPPIRGSCGWELMKSESIERLCFFSEGKNALVARKRERGMCCEWRRKGWHLLSFGASIDSGRPTVVAYVCVDVSFDQLKWVVARCQVPRGMQSIQDMVRCALNDSAGFCTFSATSVVYPLPKLTISSNNWSQKEEHFFFFI